MPLFFILFLILLSSDMHAQKRAMEHSDFEHWNSIRSVKITNDGQWMAYHLKPLKGDQELHLKHIQKDKSGIFPRAEDSNFSFDGRYLAFRQGLSKDSVDVLRRKKVKTKDMPYDTLVIVDTKTLSTVRVEDLRSFTVPQKWDGWICYQLNEKRDTSSSKKEEKEEEKTEKKNDKKPKAKKQGKKNGYHLYVHKLGTDQIDTIKYVLSYSLAKEAATMIYQTTGTDSTNPQGLYYYDVASGKHDLLHQSKKKMTKTSIHKDGQRVAFVIEASKKADQIKTHDLYYWQKGQDTAWALIRSSELISSQQHRVSPDASLSFSDDGTSFTFGLADIPMVADTNLLPEESVNVEIWHYQNGRLHTQQNAELSRDKKKSFMAYYHIDQDRWVTLGSDTISRVYVRSKGNMEWAMGRSYKPYEQLISWEGFPRTQDVYSIETSTGHAKKVITKLKGSVFPSAHGDYIYWYNALDSTWYAFSHEKKTTVALSKNIPTSMADERNDVPNVPYAYGVMGWAEKDAYVYLYDRYDIWKVDPKDPSSPVNLTNGRGQRKQYRYIDLDYEDLFIEDQMLLKIFNEQTKSEGYATFDKKGTLMTLLEGNYKVSYPYKAKDTDDILFTKESFEQFPELIHSNLTFKKQKVISHANPQKDELLWGTAELYDWVSLEGIPLQGLLYKPENFDSTKKYPLLVYFYERYSDRLHQHRGIVRSRSSINPTFYTSRGYVVFMPDIVYRTGYPGESCYNAVIPGVTSLIDRGFIDKDKIGVQGHSWGGYQIAYLVTKTNIFKCAEAGAPVSNMISAYGGIRWQTGLSRMFQYEHTQSRLGGTLWEKPLRYIENSPIFFIDKIQTPLLLLHNDKDGHVPWYQGIEMYVAMRRLGKPAWMLNYNDEPHWPTSYQNIRDLTIRMQQFFDHYLMDKPMPEWMYRGIPAIEKGINDGLQLMEKE